MNLTPVNHEIHMYIDNEEIVCDKEIQVAEKLSNTNSTVLNNCYPLSWEDDKDYVSRFYFPKDYSKFVMTINGEIKFRGVVKRSAPVNLSPFEPHWAKLQVLDYKTFLSEGSQLNFVLKDVTISQAISRILEAYSGYNFVVGNLNIGEKVNDIIKNYNCNEKTPYDCLNYIADLTQSIWVTRYEDNNVAIDFYSYDKLPNGNHILYDKEYFKNNSIISINHSFDSDDYRNVQIVKADDVQSTALIQNSFIVNGVKETFVVEEPVATIQSLTLVTFGTREKGVSFDVYYKYNSNEIVIEKENIAGTTLKITYYPVVNGRQKVKNTAEIVRIAEQNSNIGEITRYEKRDEAFTSQELGQIAQSYLYFKGVPTTELEVKTINNDMWHVGEICFFDNNNVKELEDLTGNYIVKSKTITIIQNSADNTAQIFYEYLLINNYNFESAVNFFDNQRAKMIGNINDGDFINRYIDLENSLDTEYLNIVFDGLIIENLVAENELEAELEFYI